MKEETTRYHLRRQDKAMTDRAELDRLLRSQRFVTLALCRDNEPYLTTVNHGYDPASESIYFHCAGKGKKIDFLRANPKVWGIAIEDQGYLDGACDHAYRSVMFSGDAVFVTDASEKEQALEIMIRQLESDPEKVMAEQLGAAKVEAVTIVRVAIKEMTGKTALGPGSTGSC